MAELSTLAYPRHVHLPSHFGEWRSRVVFSPAECAEALDAGYALEPVIVPDEEALPGEDAEASEPTNLGTPEQATEPDATEPAPTKRKGGRPKKQKQEG